jgi:hypothetical protein
MYERFAELTGLEKWNEKSVSQEFALNKVMERLRQVLGIQELTKLRADLVQRALREHHD